MDAAEAASASAHHAVHPRYEQLLQLKHLACGGVAGCAAKTVVAPLSRVTILMQVQSMRPHKFVDGVNPNNLYLSASLRKILREEGLLGLWRGNCATLAHRFPYCGVTFYANAALRRHLDEARWARRVPDRARGLVAGGGSACLGVLLCYPLDVVKTRLIAQTKREYYRGVFDALYRIRRDEGFRGWYRGLGVTLLTVVPSLALNFALYEEFVALYDGVGVPSSVHSLAAGGSSGAAASAALFPVDLLRRQMQMVGFGGRPDVYANAFQAICRVYETGRRRHPRHRLSAIGVFFGFREFFRGLVPELIKVVPYSAIMFSVHSHLLSAKRPFEAWASSTAPI